MSTRRPGIAKSGWGWYMSQEVERTPVRGEEAIVDDKRGFGRRWCGDMWALQEEEVLPAMNQIQQRIWIWFGFGWWDVDGGDLDPLFRLEHEQPLQEIVTGDQRQ